MLGMQSKSRFVFNRLAFSEDVRCVVHRQRELLYPGSTFTIDPVFSQISYEGQSQILASSSTNSIYRVMMREFGRLQGISVRSQTPKSR